LFRRNQQPLRLCQLISALTRSSVFGLSHRDTPVQRYLPA
jgi:hypothetical protein